MNTVVVNNHECNY